MIKVAKHDGEVLPSRLNMLELEIGFNLPKTYLSFIMPNDGCTLEYDQFLYFDEEKQRKVGSYAGTFLKINPSSYNDDFISKYTRLSTYEFFPEGILAFSECNGDYICFDYRKGKDNPNPPIVYWNHEAEEGKDVSFLANNFEEFLGILKTDEEMDELLK